MISFENIYFLITLLEIITGKEILSGVPKDFIELISFINKEWKEAGEDSVWYDPATWKVFDFIGDLQAALFGIDRDNPPTWASLWTGEWGTGGGEPSPVPGSPDRVWTGYRTVGSATGGYRYYYLDEEITELEYRAGLSGGL